MFHHRHVPGFELRSAWSEASASTQNENTSFQKPLCRKKCIIISELAASFWNGGQAEVI
jgi:hypothetical protein